uniref:DUF1618 domain-containing protein n=1 Tax=Oryza meridionalis TaxID=40149 RepID=A0A0E0BZW0_9ORYZ
MAELEMARLQEERAAEEEMQMREAAKGRWLILVCVPHVAHDEFHFPPGTELRLNFGAPPFASRITVPRRIAPDRKAIDNYPYLAAADERHGRLLLYATQGPDPEPRPALDAFYLRPLGVHHGFAKAYFICDTTTREASRLPDPDHPFAILHPGNVGLLCYSISFYVAELQPAPASGTATLLLYRSDSDAWVDEELSYPPHDRPWGGNGVVSHQDRLWWVDLSYGLLTCDVVYGDDPQDLRYVPLPQDSELPAGTPDLEKRRCVGVSAGRLRYVQIDDEPDGDPIVRMWTLLDEDAGEWGFDCAASFVAIWDDEAYKATKLPRQVPAVALIHPTGPGDVVYFFLRSRIFAVDVRARRLLEWRFFEMLHPPMRYHSSQFAEAFEALEMHWGSNEIDGLWLVLVCVPHVVHGDYFVAPDVENGAKVGIPPRATRLIVHRSIAPHRKTIDDHPYVAGTDSHGHLLLYATQGPQPEPPVLDGFYRGPLGVHHGFPKAYFIYQGVHTHRSTRLPDPDDRPILHPGNAALVGVSREKFFVADLQPTVGADHSSLLLYSSVSQAWLECELNYPPHDRPWGANGTVVYQKRIWWVDLSYGLLGFDLSAPHRGLHFIPLPDGCELPPGTADIDKRRCVGMDMGDLRYVQIDERDGDPIVRMWTLLIEDTGKWTLNRAARFQDIWNDEGYKATKLPQEGPTVALIHPNHPGEVAYFFLHSRLFGVDLRTSSVIEWHFFQMLNPPIAYHSSRFVRAWEIRLTPPFGLLSTIGAVAYCRLRVTAACSPFRLPSHSSVPPGRPLPFARSTSCSFSTRFPHVLMLHGDRAWLPAHADAATLPRARRPTHPHNACGRRSKPTPYISAAKQAKHKQYWWTRNRKWMVMACVPHVFRGDRPRGFDCGIKVNIPPRATRLAVHRSIAPRRKTIDDHPYFVASIDHHGRLLLCASQGPEPEPPVLDAFYRGPLGVHHGFPKAYFICDTRTRRCTRLPDRRLPILHPGNVCLVGSASGGFIVTDLHPTPGDQQAILFMYNSASGVWKDRVVNYPPRDRPWGGNGVVVHQMMIWWVDLSYGLLAFDQLRRVVPGIHRDLRFIPLPDGCELPPGTADLDKCRCVGLRRDDLRYVQIHKRDGDGDGDGDGDPVVSMWTLDQLAGTWSFDCEASFKAIWNDEGYRATKLPPEVPTVALIHPEHPGEVAYFFLHSRLFGVDLRACSVLECEFFAMLNPPMRYHSTRFVRAWRLPRWKGQWVTEDGSEVWMVLACVPHVVHDGYFKPGFDNGFKFRLPPGATRLVVHRSIAPRRKTIDDHPYVAGGDCHGRLLLCATQGPEPEPPVLDGFYHRRPLGDGDHCHGLLPKAYFICDTRTHKSTRLPDPGLPILHAGNACLASISCDAYLVADLHPTVVGADHATLLLYSSASGAWSNLELNYPPRDRPWGGNGVVVWPKEIWWVDLSYGFLALDLSVARRELRFVPLPVGRELPPGTGGRDLEKSRCVGLNFGELRYVEIDERDGVDPIVSMWTLLDEDAGTWSFDCEASFKAIWADEGYKATKLPPEIPTVALIHPEHPGDVAYFFLHSRLFGVHLGHCRVLEWQFFEMLHPPMAYHSSRFVPAAAYAYAEPLGLTRAPFSSSASSPAETMASASPPPSTWVILGSIPRVCGADEEGAGSGIPAGADLSLALKAPPRVSLLTIPSRIFPSATTSDNFPSVMAADPSGLLLLHADQGRAKGPTVIDRPGRQEFMWRQFVPGYFVLDAATATAVALPDPELVMHMGHMGLLASPDGGGRYVVAELQPILHADHATLLCFSSDVGEWVEKEVAYPFPPRQLAPNGAVSHSGRLWFVDLSWCLITCDPFAPAPALRFVPLPPGKELRCREAWGVLDKYRCVRVSAGKLRFVDMYKATAPHQRGPHKISVSTLADPDTEEWTLEHEASFAEIWADESYKATGLPNKIPVLALIHPENPDVVYFFLEEHLFGVDVRARKVVGCEVYELVAPPSEVLATHFVRAWELPPALSSARMSSPPPGTLSTAAADVSHPAPDAPAGSTVLAAPPCVSLDPTSPAHQQPAETVSAPPSSTWVILGSIPRVSAAADGELPVGADLSVALAAPPRVAILTISPDVFPERPTPRFFPFVLAADTSGLLLLQANLGIPMSREVVDRPHRQGLSWRDAASRYFVLNATTASAFHLPDPEEPILHQALLGLIASPRGDGHYMVAELQPLIGCDKATTLLCFSSEVGEWVEKSVRYPLPPRPLAPICVFPHHGRLWWVDLTWGVITSDPFADEPVLGFVPFQAGKVLQCREAWGVADKYRYVGVSAGKLRFVDAYTAPRRGVPPKVSVWTLADPDSTEWTLEHEARFDDIWADESYKATGLSQKIPVLALIHPENPNVVYFFLEEHLFGVDVRARKVVECEAYELVVSNELNYLSYGVGVGHWEMTSTLMLACFWLSRCTVCLMQQ